MTHIPLHEMKRKPWYRAYPEEIRKQLETYALPEIPVFRLKEHAEATPGELMEFVNGQVAPYKKLREIRIVEKMPLLASGKLNRRELNGMLHQEKT